MATVIGLLGLAAALAVGWRYFSLRRELARLADVLAETDFIDSNARLTVAYPDKAVCRLVEAINRQIELFAQNRRAVAQTEQEIRQTIAHLSHDLRTPLTSLLGYLRFIRRDEMDAQRIRYLDVIESKARILKTLVDALFGVSVLESGAYVYRREKLRVTGLLEDILADYAGEIERVMGEPQLRLTENVSIMGDKDMLDRVFRNIIQNALQHGRAPFSVETETRDGRICIHFRNKASSPEAIDISRVFDRFYCVDGAHHSRGYGLGLSVVKKLTAIMDGQVRAEYTDGFFSIAIHFPIT